MIESLIVSLILTLIIELTVFFILGIKEKDDIEVIILVNILTNPIVVFCANIANIMCGGVTYYIIVIILEITAVLVEAYIFKKILHFQKISAIKISLINNIISYGTGVIISLIQNII